MTDLKTKVSRRCQTAFCGRRIVVTLYPGDLIGLRPERTKREEIVPLAAVYAAAVKSRVAAERAARAKKRRPA